MALRSMKDLNLPEYAVVTEEVNETAESRAQFIKLAPAQNQHVPKTLADTLEQIRVELRDLRAVDVSLRIGRVETANALICMRNCLVPEDQRALQKIVPGSGKQLARDLAPDQATRDDFNAWALIHPDSADIGSIPTFFSANIDHYQHVDCLKLIFFYNQDFSIVAGSVLSDRKAALRAWLDGSPALKNSLIT